jgi:hypothetical protein
MRTALAWIAISLLPAMATPARAQAVKKNLVRNGSLEKGGAKGPVDWQRPDGLTSFWVKDPLRSGKCLRFDTDVRKEEARARWAEMEQEDPPPAKPKTPTRGKKFGTVGGADGVHFFSAPIAVRKGAAYRLDIDFLPGQCGLPGRKKMRPKVFIKGYVLHRGRKRRLYEVYKNCQGTAGKWTHNTLYFHPTDRTPVVESMRVILFPYWPPGEYFFDNVRITEVPVEVWRKEREKVKPYEKARREKLGKEKDHVFRGRTP